MTSSTIESQTIVKKVYRSFFSPAKYEAKSAEQDVLERGKNSRVRFDGGELAVTKWGDSGPAVLLVHGWGGSRAQMTGFVDPLLMAGFRVVVFDQPAHGESDGNITNFLKIAPTMKLIADQEGTFEGIIAHSFGTLITSYALVNLEFPSPARLVYLGALNRLMDSFPRFQAIAGLSDEIMQGFRELLEEEFGREVLEAIRNELLAPQIKVPALMFHDVTDNVTPVEDSRSIARVWKTARLTETDGLGHRGALQSDPIHKQVVQFLRGQGPAK
jgi:pimeloyl-ACP methyl ester carboxylesterase